MFFNDLYFSLRTFIPPIVRREIRRRFVTRQRRQVKDFWPIQPASEQPSQTWRGWPEEKRFAFVLSHDVEGQRGLDRVRGIARLELELGFRSSFNFVPEGEYRVPTSLRRWLTEHGFEVGVHDLHHDGKLYSSREEFQDRAKRINGYLRHWNAVGFRSAFMLHNLDWLGDLEILYDASTFDTDPFEPQPDGVNTIFPFWVPRQSETDFLNSRSSALTRSRNGYMELPYTLPQDSTLFLLLREKTNNIWKQKLDWLARHGGMSLLNTHPDYIRFDGEGTSQEFPVALYKDFLQYVKAKYKGQYWHALPRDVALHCLQTRVPQPRVRRRACMVCYSFYESDNRVMRYARSLAARGDHVDVIALGRGDDFQVEETLDGVHVHKVQRRHRNEKNQFSYLSRVLRFLLVSSVALTRRHLRQPYDIIHVHNIPDFLVFSAWFAKLAGAAVILDIHDVVPEFYASKFPSKGREILCGSLKTLERISMAFADHVIISNDLWFDLITSRSVRKEKCSVFINYVDADLFKAPERQRNPDKPLVLYPGGLQWHQGLDIAIRAFAKVSKELPSAEFHIYGEGPEKGRLIDLARSLELSDKVLFFRSLPVREIRSLMAKADLGVVPKRASSFGNEAYSTKIMEFMSLGVPLVVSKTRIDSFYFDDSVVRFCESENVEDFAQAIIELLTNNELRERLVANAQRYVVNNRWADKKQRYLDLVDRLISEVKGSRSNQAQKAHLRYFAAKM
ncbi:MAG TPA: glycosyltransferase [Terrimicrobiaceae bacterium]